MNSIFCFSIPSAGEWLFLIMLVILVVAPIVAIAFYSKMRSLKKENEFLRAERNTEQRDKK
jgi:hypothetical protein